MYSVPDNAPIEDKAIIQLVNQGLNPERLFKAALTVQSRVIADNLQSQDALVVENGIYKGMKLFPNYIGSMLLPKIIGTYELEVQQILEAHTSTCNTFIDIGCAEGFHLIGMARLLNKPCIGIDINPACAEAIAAIAKANNVGKIVSLKSKISDAVLEASDNITILIDVDGSEMPVLQELELSLNTTPHRPIYQQLIIETDRNPSGQSNQAQIIDFLCARNWSIEQIQPQIPSHRFSTRLSHLSFLDQVVYGCEGRPGGQCWIRATR